jgi:hypothetical protein
MDRDRLYLRHILEAVWAMVEKDLSALRSNAESLEASRPDT